MPMGITNDNRTKLQESAYDQVRILWKELRKRQILREKIEVIHDQTQYD